MEEKYKRLGMRDAMLILAFRQCDDDADMVEYFTEYHAKRIERDRDRRPTNDEEYTKSFITTLIKYDKACKKLVDLVKRCYCSYDMGFSDIISELENWQEDDYIYKPWIETIDQNIVKDDAETENECQHVVENIKHYSNCYCEKCKNCGKIFLAS